MDLPDSDEAVYDRWKKYLYASDNERAVEVLEMELGGALVRGNCSVKLYAAISASFMITELARRLERQLQPMLPIAGLPRRAVLMGVDIPYTAGNIIVREDFCNYRFRKFPAEGLVIPSMLLLKILKVPYPDDIRGVSWRSMVIAPLLVSRCMSAGKDAPYCE